mgnify:CR=1 FL=1
MIVKMKFINITGPKDDIDRVAEQYLSKYEIQCSPLKWAISSKEVQHEADRLTTAIEGIRYGLGYNEILSYIS